jgi:hypothetical protein
MKLNRIVYALIGTLLVSWWLVWSLKVTIDPLWMPPRDSLVFNFHIFRYLVSWIREFGTIPNWIYKDFGGMWIAPLGNNLLIAAPHRLIGLAIASITSFNSITLYKLTFFIIGNGIFFSGLYLFFKKFFESSVEALLAVGIISVSSLMFGIIHQEQAMGTILFVPWIWYFIWRLKDDFTALLPVGALIGLSLNFHYPQILFLYWMFVFAVLMISKSYQFVKFPKPGKTALIIAASFVLLILCALPLLYAYHTYYESLASSYRGKLSQVYALSWSDYLEFNNPLCSVVPKNLLGFLGFHNFSFIAQMDQILLYGLGLMPVALMAFLGRWNRKTLSALAIMGFLAVTSVGIYGPVPFLIWNKMPGMSMFRQWYHFVPILLIHVLAMTVWFSLRPQEFFSEKRYPIVVGAAVLFLYLLAWKYHYVAAGFVVIFGLAFFFTALMILKKLKPERTALLLCLTLAAAVLLHIPDLTREVNAYVTRKFVADSSGNKLIKKYFDDSVDPLGGFGRYGMGKLVVIKDYAAPERKVNWEMFKGLEPVNTKVNVEFKDGRVVFKNIPAEVDTINIYQYNDGRWMIPDNAWKIQKGLSYLALKRNQNADLIISRSSDAWWTLVLVSYLLTLFAVIYFMIHVRRGVDQNNKV